MPAASVTLAAILDEVESEYGKMTDELRSRLPEKLNRWIKEICGRFDFWFLTYIPGSYAPTLFPLSGNPPTLTPLAEGCWMDVGWLYTTAGQATYQFSVPNDLSSPKTAIWSRPDVGGIEYVQTVPWTGGHTHPGIEVMDHGEFNMRADIGVMGRPRMATLRTINNQGIIEINPVPDGNGPYIFQVCFRLRDLPMLVNPQDSNALLVEYPQAAIIRGCFEAAKFFLDYERAEFYRDELEGKVNSPMTGVRTGGLLNEMRIDTLRRHRTRFPVAKTYTSPPSNLSQRRLGPGWTSTGGVYPAP